MEERVYPAEAVFERELDAGPTRWAVPPVMEDLKAEAKAEGLWNLFLPESEHGAGLSNLEYAPALRVDGPLADRAPRCFNCSAPDTGNMEILVRYGTPEQKERWLKPLLAGEIRSCFAMTEPAVASSDATNIRAEIRRDGDDYVINGRKWWTSGAHGHALQDRDRDGQDRSGGAARTPAIDDPGADGRARRHGGARRSPCSATTTRRTATPRSMFENVRVPAANMLLGEGRGFEIAQGRLGPGRIHHCMRTIGVAERALETHVPARARRAPPSASRSPTRA